MTFKKAGLVLVWIDRRILCLHSTARYWANLLYKLPSLTRGENNTVFHQPQDPQNRRTWDLWPSFVYERGRAWYNHKSMTLHVPRTETTPILTPWRHPIFHHKETQPELSRATSLYLNPTTSPNHRTATESCCQWDTQQDTRTAILRHLWVVVSLFTSIFIEAAEKETNHYVAH